MLGANGVRQREHHDAQQQHEDRRPGHDPKCASPRPAGGQDQAATNRQHPVDDQSPPPPESVVADLGLAEFVGSALAAGRHFPDDVGVTEGILVLQPNRDQQDGESEQEASREHQHWDERVEGSGVIQGNDTSG